MVWCRAVLISSTALTQCVEKQQSREIGFGDMASLDHLKGSPGQCSSGNSQQVSFLEWRSGT